MNVTVYWKEDGRGRGSITSLNTPYANDVDFDVWNVGIAEDTGEKGTWGVFVNYAGSDKGTGRGRNYSIARCKNARSREGYLDWLEQNVYMITVDGHPLWASEEA